MDWMFPAAAALTGAMGLGMALWGLWYVGVALFCLRRPPDYGRRPARARFAVLIAARNEELVIGPLINSLLTQDYPAELYDIWVIPNNCTDHTAQAARSFGARVLPCARPVRTKGEVLRYAYERLRGRGYDAWCVFDADNLVHRRFLAEMNSAWLAGAQAAQGFRDSKNPYDTPLSGCSSLYYWMLNRFHNGGRAGLDLSALITGTGFMISSRLLDRLGGWNSETISEDLELTAQCVLAGERVWWVPEAITYDEQPLTWAESRKQRRRWSSGTIQVARLALPRVLGAMGEAPRLALADLGATLMIPAYQLAALAGLACGASGRRPGRGHPGGGPAGGGGRRPGQPALRRPHRHPGGVHPAAAGGPVGPAAPARPGAVLAVPAVLAAHHRGELPPGDHPVGGDPPHPKRDPGGPGPVIHLITGGEETCAEICLQSCCSGSPPWG